MNNRFPTVPQIFGAHPRFQYSAPWSECRVIHEHHCMGTHLLIVGDPDSGGYEWVILVSGKVQSHSNDGYGISEVALRDGLIEAFKDCFTAKPNPAHKETLEKHHDAITAAAAVNAATAAESHHRAQQRVAELLLPVRQREEAKSPPEASAAPHTVTDAPPSSPAASGPASSPPHSDAGTPTTSALVSSPAICPVGTSAGTPHPSPHGTNPPVPAPLLAADHPGNGSATAAAVPSLQAPEPTGSKKDSTSAHTGESCGDINCDGRCQPATAPDLRPSLIRSIDTSPTVDDAREATADATPDALRAAARFLRTDMHSLPNVLLRRVRERLAKPAA